MTVSEYVRGQRPCRLGVVIAVGVTLIMSAAGIIWLRSTGQEPGGDLQALAFGCLSGLIGLLAPAPATSHRGDHS